MAESSLPTLHVVFGHSAAASLEAAVALAGRSDKVVALSDDLSLGPIDPADPHARAQWIESELGYDWLADLLRMTHTEIRRP